MNLRIFTLLLLLQSFWGFSLWAIDDSTRTLERSALLFANFVEKQEALKGEGLHIFHFEDPLVQPVANQINGGAEMFVRNEDYQWALERLNNYNRETTGKKIYLFHGRYYLDHRAKVPSPDKSIGVTYSDMASKRERWNAYLNKVRQEAKADAAYININEAKLVREVGKHLKSKQMPLEDVLVIFMIELYVGEFTIDSTDSAKEIISGVYVDYASYTVHYDMSASKSLLMRGWSWLQRLSSADIGGQPIIALPQNNIEPVAIAHAQYDGELRRIVTHLMTIPDLWGKIKETLTEIAELKKFNSEYKEAIENHKNILYRELEPSLKIKNELLSWLESADVAIQRMKGDGNYVIPIGFEIVGIPSSTSFMNSSGLPIAEITKEISYEDFIDIYEYVRRTTNNNSLDKNFFKQEIYKRPDGQLAKRVTVQPSEELSIKEKLRYLINAISIIRSIYEMIPDKEKEPGCRFCPPEKVISKRACEEMEKLYQKAGANATAEEALKKLCSQNSDFGYMTVYNGVVTYQSELIIIADLQALRDNEIRVFFEDILCKNNITDAPDNSRSICNFVGNLSGDHIKAWKICKDARPNSAGLRLDWDILRSVVDYENNPQLKADLNIESTDRFLKILKEYSGECNTCKPNPNTCARLPRMHIYLNRLKDFVIKYRNKTGFNSFITGEATAASLNKQDGANHLMRRLNESSYPASDALSFEGNIHSKIPAPSPQAICDCKYDIEEPGGVLVDYKSFDCDSPLGNPNQLKQYLQYWDITQTPPHTFEYVFNADKINLEQAKKKFVALLNTDPKGFYDVNPAFFQNFRYNGLVITATILQTACQDSSFWQNPLFNFVSITP